MKKTSCGFIPKLFLILFLFLSGNVRADFFVPVTSATVGISYGVESSAYNPNGLVWAEAVSSGSFQVGVWSFDGSALTLQDSFNIGSLNYLGSAVAWSPDGNYLAATFSNIGPMPARPTILIIFKWDGSSLTEVARVTYAAPTIDFGIHMFSPRPGLAWSPLPNPDGSFNLAVGSLEYLLNAEQLVIYQFNGITSTLTKRIGTVFVPNVADEVEVNSISWSNDGSLVTAGGHQGGWNGSVGTPVNGLFKVYQIDTTDWSLTEKDSRVFAATSQVTSVGWNRNMQYIEVGEPIGPFGGILSIYGWDNSNKTLLDPTVTASKHLGSFSAAAWSPYGDYIGVSSGLTVVFYQWDSNYARFINLDSSATLALANVSSIAWTPDAHYVTIPVSNSSILTYQSDVAFLTNGTTQGKTVSGDATIGQLTNLPLTQNVEIPKGNSLIPANQQIVIAGNLTINGRGSTLTFCRADNPQFVVKPGFKVRLENITLSGINAKTFDLQWMTSKVGSRLQLTDSQIEIGDNVSFELSEDVVISSGVWVLDGDNFTIRGLNGQRKLTFDPTDAYVVARGTAVPVMFELNSYAATLQEINLIGLEHISLTIVDRGLANELRTEFHGTIVLNGNATASVGDVNAGNNQVCPQNFLVKGSGNVINIKVDNVTFTGSLNFSDNTGNNAVSFVSTLQNGVSDPARNYTAINFNDNFALVESLNGNAIVNFADQKIQINNKGANSFVVGDNSRTAGQTVSLVGSPIRDQSGATLSFMDVNKGENLGLRVSASKSLAELDVSNIFNDISGQVLVRRGTDVALRVPVSLSFTPPQIVNTQIDLKNSVGIITLNGSTGNRFSIGDESAGILFLSLQNSSVLNLVDDEDVTLKAEDTIVISGKNNIINVEKTFYIDGALTFEPGAELTFAFASPYSRVVVNGELPSGLITLQAGCKLIFKNPGEARFDTGCRIVSNLDSLDKNSNLVPQIICQDGASIKPSAGLTVNGICDWFIKNGGVIDLTSSSESENVGILRLGTTLNDTINLNISSSGAVLLNGFSVLRMLSTNGKLLIGGNSKINILQGGIVDIGSGGQVGINIDENGGIIPGICEGIFLDPAGMLFLQPGGKLSIAANKNENNPAGNNYIEWSGLTALILGADSFGNMGLVEYVALNGLGFAGQINPDNTKFDEALTAAALVRRLINRSHLLTNAVEYKDTFGSRFIALKNGVEIAMVSGDEVTGEDESSGVVSAKSAQGQIVLYKLDGTRVVLKS